VSPEVFIQIVVNGLVIGMIYILVASGLTLILGVAGIFNFAHGEFYMLGAYVAYAVCVTLGLNFAFAVVVSILVVGVLGGVAYRAIFHHVRRDLLMCVLASVGLSLILKQSILLTVGRIDRGIPSVFQGTLSIGAVSVSVERVMVIVLCLVVMLALYLVLMRTKLGKAMRAVSIDVEAASLLGIKVDKIYMTTMAVGCAAAGVAGAIIAPVFAVTSDMGSNVLLLSFMVLMLGGFGTIGGAVLGGVVLGQALSFGYEFFGGLAQLFAFGVVFVVLFFKPSGLLGRSLEY
jgi:branched-chain amino acid transport system permease protein